MVQQAFSNFTLVIYTLYFFSYFSFGCSIFNAIWSHVMIQNLGNNLNFNSLYMLLIILINAYIIIVIFYEKKITKCLLFWEEFGYVQWL